MGLTFKATVRRKPKKIPLVLALNQSAPPNTAKKNLTNTPESVISQPTSYTQKGRKVYVGLIVMREIDLQEWLSKKRPNFI